MVLAGIIAARSIGGSFLNHMSSILYCGKSGRKLALRKMVSVLAISGMLYLALSLLITVYYVYRFRLNLYWDVPLASMVYYYGNSTIPRFAITIGGYWWFQLGVGLGTVLIMEFLCRFCDCSGRFSAVVGADPDGACCTEFIPDDGQPYRPVFTSREFFAGAVPVFHPAPL